MHIGAHKLSASNNAQRTVPGYWYSVIITIVIEIDMMIMKMIVLLIVVESEVSLPSHGNFATFIMEMEYVKIHYNNIMFVTIFFSLFVFVCKRNRI